MFALILNCKVVQVSSEEFPVAAALSWVSVPDGETVSVGDTYTDGKFSEQQPAIISLQQQANLALIDAHAYVNKNYIFLAETPPSEWVAYQKALIAIASGTDTSSTVLPAAPTS